MATAWTTLVLWRPILLATLAFAAGCGLLAVFSPRWFGKLAHMGGQWVDSQRYVKWLDARFDIDRFVLRHARAFGVCVLSAVIFLAVQWIAWNTN
jgi:hypothetical protein